ncbi:MAG: DNA polymerase/3'-5' exonuclease PolX [Candidatus Sumerlaeia bacterium]|nr:DNA polymerase/3'-5' exonuclease PolX [Candidatus Sumerlaeia bacterium]
MALAQQLTPLFQEFIKLLQLDNANSFKIIAYQKAVEALASGSVDWELHVKNKTLTQVDGIGKGIAEKIEEFASTRALAELVELREKYPSGLLEMLEIPGFGAKKARAVFEELGVATLAELKAACEDGRVAGLKGFGAKSAQNILKGIVQLQEHAGRHRLDEAWRAALPLLEFLRGVSAVETVEVAGSLRRSRETVKDLDFVCATREPLAVMAAFCAHGEVERVVGQGDTKASVVLRSGLNADLRCVTPEQFPFTLQHFTGSKEHNTALRSRAKELGLKSNEYGLFREGEEVSLPAATEADVYRHLQLEWIAPERRENHGEIEQAARGTQPKLIEHADLCGILHLHTTFSDGKPTLREYAEWAAVQGIRWMGISDHSQTASYAGGMTPDRVHQQWREIEALNAEFAPRNVRLLKGVESDILRDGSLDYEDELLAGFDFIIASVHSLFNLSEEEQTARIIRAVEHPRTTILGHLTGRLLLKRESYALNIREVITACARNGVAIEINCNPYRLELDWRHLGFALEQGVKVCLSPDAHAMEGLGDVCYGLGIARKGGCTAADVLNTHPEGWKKR